MKLAIGQVNTTIGDIGGNRGRIGRGIQRAEAEGVSLVIFPELALVGYPPGDLLLKPRFIRDSLVALDGLAEKCRKTRALVGGVRPNEKGHGRELMNSAALLAEGRIAGFFDKSLLPAYDVFDEARYFEPAEKAGRFPCEGFTVGVTLCEDIWPGGDPYGGHLWGHDPVAELAAGGVDLLVNLSASPFVLGKHDHRLEHLARQARAYNRPLVFCNQVCGADELIFAGNSVVLDAKGKVIAHAKDFEEDFLVVDLENPAGARCEKHREGMEALHAALCLGLRDYVRKCRFEKVVIGLSGGIDSALTAVLAVEALGADNIMGIAMPSRYSSSHSVEDARRLAETLGVEFHVISIEQPHRGMEGTLGELFAGLEEDVTEENIQARLRGNILMAVSNKFRRLVLCTGNKSELAVGYCTLYGDMTGGLAVIGDVPKTTVYRLARYCNRNQPVIPESTLTKPPSAELRPDQKDADSLPPYEVLDPILERYVEREESVDEIVEAGFEVEVVEKVIRLVDMSEYKRHQAAPVLKVTGRAFGRGRRMPISAAAGRGAIGSE